MNGDWGLGIGDWAQSPIPNPQSPIPNPQSPMIIKIYIFINNNKLLINYIFKCYLKFIFIIYMSIH